MSNEDRIKALVQRMMARSPRMPAPTHVVRDSSNTDERSGVYCFSQEQAETVLSEARSFFPDDPWEILELSKENPMKE